MEDVDADDFFLAECRRHDLSLLRKTLAAMDVDLVLVAQAAHQAAARAGTLRGIEGQPLVLRDAEVPRPQLRQPRSGAVLASATADAIQSLGFIAHADLLQLDPGAEQRSKIAHEVAEIDPLVRSEVERELLAIPLPLGVRELHAEVVGANALHCLAAGFLVEAIQILREPAVLLGRQPQRFPLREGSTAPVGATAISFLRELA